MVCKRVIYSGRVQGVGFRYRVCEVAAGLPVVGYVMNLPDGTVEMVAQGDPDCVRELIRQVDEVMQGNIHGKVMDDKPVGEFTGFRVRR